MTTNVCPPLTQPILHNPVTQLPIAPLQIEGMTHLLNDFINQCNAVNSLLQTALVTENADSATPNLSWYGSIISNMSRIQNHQAADAVDRLSQQATLINREITKLPVYLPPINSYFSGNEIRSSEEAEHNFWLNLFTGDEYSSQMSRFTACQLWNTISKVNAVRSEALSRMEMLHRSALTGSNGSFIPSTLPPLTTCQPMACV